MTELERVTELLGAGPGRVRLAAFTREDLARLFADLGYVKGMELGVFEGYYSAELCKANPRLQLTSIDCWENGVFAEAYAKAQEALKSFNATLIKSKGDDALDKFPDNSLDFVYIDADHRYLSVSHDIYFWNEKVRIGGIVAGHDYHFITPYDGDVIQAVNEFTAVQGISPWYVTSEDVPSWFWVKT